MIIRLGHGYRKTVIEAGPLPQHWSAQRAELWALIWTLQLSKKERVNIFTDSRYAFATLHVHGALYRERDLLTANEKDIKNKEKILTLLDAVWDPRKVAVMHCHGRQKKDTPTPQARKNKLADETAKQASKDIKMTRQASITTLVLTKLPELVLDSPTYTEAQDQLAKAEGATRMEKRWWTLPNNKLLVPEELAPSLVSQAHQ